MRLYLFEDVIDQQPTLIIIQYFVLHYGARQGAPSLALPQLLGSSLASGAFAFAPSVAFAFAVTPSIAVAQPSVRITLESSKDSPGSHLFKSCALFLHTYRRGRSRDDVDGVRRAVGRPSLDVDRRRRWEQTVTLPMEVGSLHTATVASVRPFGVFVRVAGRGKDALVHHTQVSDEVSFTRDDDDAMRQKALDFYAPRGTQASGALAMMRSKRPTPSGQSYVQNVWNVFAGACEDHIR